MGWSQPQPAQRTNWTPLIVIGLFVLVVTVILVVGYFSAQDQVQKILQQVGASV